MAERPVIRFYLVHAETGQRYPIADQDVVVGRSSGDVVFPEDATLAPAQCRVLPSGRAEGATLAVQNLAGAAEVRVNGRVVAVNEMRPLGVDDRLVVGAQAFRLVEVRRSTRPAAKTSRADRRPPSTISNVTSNVWFVAFVVGALAFAAYRWRRPESRPPALPAAYQVDHEVDRMLEVYRQIGAAQARGEAEDVLAAKLRRDLIPGLERAEQRQPAAPLIKALLRQTRLMASYYETGDPDLERALEAASAELTRVLAERQLGTRRAKPATDELPTATPPGK